ncbi:MAG: hypothetical protein M3Z01_01955 [Thermoproteota archaeon]|nr:hypothetical protein [Thermoproteota archaeon]
MSSNERYRKDKKKIKKKFDKKGILITIFIVIGIFGASFIVWFLPQGNVQNNNNGNNMMIFSNPNDTLISAINQHTLIKNELHSQLNGFSMSNQSNLTQVKNSIDASIKQNNDLMQTLLNGNPSGAMVPSYVKMMNILKNFSFYLIDIKNITSSSSSSSASNLTKDLTAAQKKWLVS